MIMELMQVPSSRGKNLSFNKIRTRGKGPTLTPSCTADLDLFVCFSSPESQRRKERKHPKPAATMNLGNLIAGLLIAIIAIIAICAGLGWYSRR
jgi:hypothetical protein